MSTAEHIELTLDDDAVPTKSGKRLERLVLERLRRTEAELKVALFALENAEFRHRMAMQEAAHTHAAHLRDLHQAIGIARATHQQVVLEIESRYSISLQHHTYDPDTGEVAALHEDGAR